VTAVDPNGPPRLRRALEPGTPDGAAENAALAMAVREPADPTSRPVRESAVALLDLCVNGLSENLGFGAPAAHDSGAT
jgi:hypothetical protein